MTVEFRKWNSEEAEEYTVAEFREYLGRKNIARIRAESACTEIGDTGSELYEGIGGTCYPIFSVYRVCWHNLEGGYVVAGDLVVVLIDM